MTFAPGPAGEPTGPDPSVDPSAGAVDYPSRDYPPTPPPGWAPPPGPPSYLPPPSFYPPPGPYPPPAGYLPQSPYPPPSGYPPPNFYAAPGGYPPPYQPYGSPYVDPSTNNGLAVAALVCSLV